MRAPKTNDENSASYRKVSAKDEKQKTTDNDPGGPDDGHVHVRGLRRQRGEQ
jgi:hypothetical protein